MTPSATLVQQLKDGIAAVQAKNFANARVLLQPVAEAFPHDARPWFWLAVASPSADAAIPCLRRVLAIEPSHAQARQALAKLLLTHGAALVTTGRRDDARALVKEATTLTPDNDRVWVALAVVNDDPAVRLDALQRAHAINPAPTTREHLLHALLQRAQALAAGDPAAARALYLEFQRLDPRDLRAWHGLTGLADTTSEALDMARGFVQAAPDQEAGPLFLKQALLADARVLEVDGRSEEACLRWREALAIDEFDIDGWLGLAQSTTDEEEAQRAIARAFEIAPTDVRVSSARARIQGAVLDAPDFDIPQDAFAHLEQGDDPFAAADRDLGATIDLAADPFARFTPLGPRHAEPTAGATSHTETAAAAHARTVPTPSVEREPVIAPAPVTPPAVREARPSGDGPRRTVMIVDDSPTIRKILGLTLERADYKVVAEPDGESALERLTQVIPDVILLDIAMPRIDGYEVCRRVKADPRTAHVPVVMLSGKDAFFDKVKGRVAGASEYLTKPFETPAVLAAVAAACQSVCR